MNKILTIGSLLSFIFLNVSGCTTTTNTNNANRSAGNTMMGNAANTVGNAANTVANTISNVTSTVTGGTDNDFMRDAATAGMDEVELGKLASTKAASPEVKKFAQMMVTDHTKAGEELKTLAAKKSVPLPTEMDSSHKSILDNLKTKVGADFDKTYVDAMVSDHEKAVSDFQSRVKSASDPDVKAFAERTLPVLQKHLDAINAIKAKMK